MYTSSRMRGGAISIFLIFFAVGIGLGINVHGAIIKILVIMIFLLANLYLLSRRNKKNFFVLWALAAMILGLLRANFAEPPKKYEVEINFLQKITKQNLEKTFWVPHAYLANALISGYKIDLPKKIKDDFRAAGLSHLLAVSGYNVTLVSSALLFLLDKRVGQRLKTWALFVGIICFVFFAGAQVPVIRAGIMGAIGVLVLQSGTRAVSLRVLLLAATLMLAFNPYWLTTDIGFQLSIAATGTIIWLAPRMLKKLSMVPEIFGLRANLSTSIAAIIGTLPLVTWHFQSIAPYSLLANLLITPFIPLIMISGFGAAILGNNYVGRFIGWVGSRIVDLVLLIVSKVAVLPGASLTLAKPLLAVLLELFLMVGICLTLVLVNFRKNQKSLLS